jgi:hypothetical protein
MVRNVQNPPVRAVAVDLPGGAGPRRQACVALRSAAVEAYQVTRT